MHASRASSIDSGSGHPAPVVRRQDMVPELRELIAVHGVPALPKPEDVVHVQHPARSAPDLKKQRFERVLSRRGGSCDSFCTGTGLMEVWQNKTFEAAIAAIPSSCTPSRMLFGDGSFCTVPIN